MGFKLDYMKSISTKSRRKRVYNFSTNRIKELYCYKIQLKVFGVLWITVRKYYFADLRAPYIVVGYGKVKHFPAPNFRL